MAADLQSAIYERLAGVEALTGYGATVQTALGALLASDPDTSSPVRPAVFAGNFRSAAPVYPCVTFRLDGGVPDLRFSEGIAVGYPELTLEIWGTGGDNRVVASINRQVERLLNRGLGVAPALPVSNEKVFWMEPLTEMSVGFAEDVNAWFGLRRWRLVWGRC